MVTQFCSRSSPATSVCDLQSPHHTSAAAGSNIVELAPIGSGYDFVVHVRNVPTYGYNPEVPTDAAALGLRLARRYCRGARIVGQRVVNHEIYGITSEKPDYLVFVRCAGTTSQ
jgi:hypothetical protein